MATKTKSTAKKTKKATKKSSTAKAKKKTIPSTEFSLYAPNVNEVYLAGDFNNWQPDSKEHRLRKFKGDIWKKMLKLKPGRYEYQFVVDGQWWCDPENVNRVTNTYCTENCVIEVK
jgi:1,4-alpha-glucan branching enzyme